MFCVTAVYPRQEGASFDFDYYLAHHAPLAARFLGENFIRYEVRKGLAPDCAFVCTVNYWIHSIAAFEATMASHGAEILGDTPNFTNLQPVLQVEEVLA